MSKKCFSSSFLFFIFLFSKIEISMFSSRPGASSGILLGSVTLPAVMLSKLIQLSRSLPLHEVATEGNTLK
jgi:dolichol kinase